MNNKSLLISKCCVGLLIPPLLHLYRFGHSQLQDQINIKSLQRLTQYCERYKEKFGSAAIPLARKAKVAIDLLQQLRSQVHARRAKNTDILTLSQEVRLCDGMTLYY